MLRDIALLTLRLGTGITMAAHGFPKLFGGPNKEPPSPVSDAMGENYEPAFKEGGPENFAQALEGMDVPMPRAAAYASGATELFGGLALIFGFKTRLAALLILFNLGVAIRKAHWQTGFFGSGGFEHPMALCQSAFALLLMGPGRLAIDCEAPKEKVVEVEVEVDSDDEDDGPGRFERLREYAADHLPNREDLSPDKLRDRAPNFLPGMRRSRLEHLRSKVPALL